LSLARGGLLVLQRGTPSPRHPLFSGENSVLPGPLRPGDYSVRPPGPPVRARCRRAMVRSVGWIVPDPGSAVGSGHRWARGMTNRWVGARFVALFAGAHAPNDLVEADRARGHSSPPRSGSLRGTPAPPPTALRTPLPQGVSCPHKRPQRPSSQTTSGENGDVLPLQGEVARRAGGGPPESPPPRSPPLSGVSYPHKLGSPPTEHRGPWLRLARG